MSVPNTFASATSSIPLASLDANFAYYDTAYSISGTAVTFAGNITLTPGTANGVPYLNASKVLTSGSSLTFDGTKLTTTTLGAFTLAGTVSGGGNQINNVVLGAVTPLAGNFTTVTTTGNITPALSSNYAAATLNRPSIRPSLLLDFANTRLLDPRITFARASTATFYDATTSAVAEQNLFLQSQNFGTSWSPSAVTVTVNTTTAPDGTTTASTLIPTTAAGVRHSVGVGSAGVIGNQYTFSAYAKSNGYTNLQLFADSSGNFNATFDLTAGTAATTGGATVSIVDAGNGWYRCIAVFTMASSNRLNIQGFPTGATASNFGNTFTGDGTSGVFLWGAQLEQRSAVTAYTPTTTAAITNYIPVLQTAASGVARFDCNPVTRESLGLLIEESRTNLLVNSATFVATTNIAVTTSANVSPDGTLNASYAIPNATSGYHNTSTSATVVTATAYAMSVFAKADAYTRLGVREGTGTGTAALFDLTAGTVISGTGTITPVGNSWYRCVVPFTSSGTSAALTCFPYPSSTTNPLTIFSGDGFSGVYLWGQQLEAGSFATSYIPTVASQVTRAADSASMTGTNFSSWYNSAQGTLYMEVSKIGQTSNATYYGGFGAASNGSYFRDDGAALKAQRRGGLIGTSDISFGSTLTVGTPTKFAASYVNATTGASTGAVVSGGAVTSYSAYPLATPYVNFAFYDAGGSPASAYYIKRTAYYPVALTSTELIGLTS
jgi:hypothetical protein